ncbi:MAG: sulfotransferase domain-containing protein [Bacteroidota bacterium]
MSADHKHILVISHRRSGTHLTIDAIRNNFLPFKTSELLVFDRLLPGASEPLTTNSLELGLTQNNMVLKAHLLPGSELSDAGSTPELQLADKLLGDLPKIYVYRDGRDTMVSLFDYLKAFHKPSMQLSFKEFLRTNNHFGPERFGHMNRVAFWNHHVSSWMNKSGNILFLSFEELVNDYTTALKKMVSFIDLPVNGDIIDVRLKPKNLFRKLLDKVSSLGRKNEIQRTQVLFNKGSIGRYKSYFDEEDLEFFNAHGGELLNRLGYD